MNKQEIKRYNQYDLLRVIATIAVILIHVNYRYFAPRAYAPLWDKYYVIESIFNMVSSFQFQYLLCFQVHFYCIRLRMEM